MAGTVQPVSQTLAGSKLGAIAPYIRDEQYTLRDLSVLKRRSLIWTTFGLGISALGIAGAVVSSLFGTSSLNASLISFIFLAACYLLFLWLLVAFVRMRAVTGHFPELAAYDNRKPILYLRNFAAENPNISNPNMPIRMSFEHLLGTAFRSYGRVVALGDPMQRRPTGSVSRLFVTDTGWREAVSCMMEQAQAVVIDYAPGTNVDWEVDQSQRFADLPRLVVMIVTRAANERRVSDLRAPSALQAAFATSKARLPSGDKVLLGIMRGPAGEAVFARKPNAVGFSKIINLFKRNLGRTRREELPATIETLRAKLHKWTHLPTYCAFPGLVAIMAVVATTVFAPGLWD